MEEMNRVEDFYRVYGVDSGSSVNWLFGLGLVTADWGGASGCRLPVVNQWLIRGATNCKHKTSEFSRAIPGVCHRDLKSQNLLVDPLTHQLKICNFGSAKVLVLLLDEMTIDLDVVVRLDLCHRLLLLLPLLAYVACRRHHFLSDQIWTTFSINCRSWTLIGLVAYHPSAHHHWWLLIDVDQIYIIVGLLRLIGLLLIHADLSGLLEVVDLPAILHVQYLLVFCCILLILGLVWCSVVNGFFVLICVLPIGSFF
ncbi:hypothetical protein Dimus_003419 [Dionaea muscipula]